MIAAAIRVATAIGFLLAAAVPANAVAQAYPSRPIRVILPNAPGGSADIVLRSFQRPLEAELGQPVVIVNVAGGGTTVGTRQARDAAPDGHTVMMFHEAMLGTAAQGMLGFGPEAFSVVAETGYLSTAVIARRSMNEATLQDVLALARARPNEVKFGAQISAHGHLLLLRLSDSAGVRFRLTQVGGGGGPTMTALLGGHIDLSFAGYPELEPYYRADEVRVLALLAPQRHPLMPNVPTARELGVDMLARTSWWWWMPAATPGDRIDRFAMALERAFANPDLRERLAALGNVLEFHRGDAARQRVQRAYEETQGVVARHNLRRAN